MQLSRLVKSRRAQVDHHIDYLTARGVGGWAFASGDHKVRLQVWSGGQCISAVVASDDRPDVEAAFNRAPNSLRSGFHLAFTLPADGLFAEVQVRLLVEDRRGRVVETIEGPAAQFLTDAGLQAVKTPSAAPQHSPFPRAVAAAVRTLWPDAPVESSRDADQLAVVEKVLQLAAQPAAEELAPLTAYVRYLRAAWGHFDFVRRYFPRINKNRSAADRDFSCMPNTPEELFTIAHHLYVMKSCGAEGALAEFGCYKGYSTAMLSYACRLLAIPMHVFDSFAGLPPSDHTYQPGQFAGSLDEVKSHVALYGSPEVVTFHKGFFSQTLPTLEVPRFLTLWMDVDLESSAEDVMTVFDRIDPRGAVFTHECEPRFFDGDRIVAKRDAIAVVPPIAEAFERAGAPARGRFLSGCTGAFWRRDGGIPVLGDAPIRRLLAGI